MTWEKLGKGRMHQGGQEDSQLPSLFLSGQKQALRLPPNHISPSSLALALLPARPPSSAPRAFPHPTTEKTSSSQVHTYKAPWRWQGTQVCPHHNTKEKVVSAKIQNTPHIPGSRGARGDGNWMGGPEIDISQYVSWSQHPVPRLGLGARVQLWNFSV